MSAGGYYVAGSDTVSAARANQKSVTIDTGTNLAALSPTYAYQLIVATDNSSGSFTAGTMYQRNGTNSAWLPFIPATQHDHTAATVAAGGTLNTVMSNNTGQFIYQNDLLSPRASELRATVVGGTVTDNNTAGQWSVKIDTGATTNNYAQADLGGIALDLGSPFKFQCKVGQGVATNATKARIGTNMETINLAVLNTQKVVGFEFCDTVNTTYYVASGDGTTRSTQNTTVGYSGVHSLKLAFNPGVSIIGQVDAATATTKTLNVPSSGFVQEDYLMRFGIQTTTTQTQTLTLYGAVICYVPSTADGWVV